MKLFIGFTEKLFIANIYVFYLFGQFRADFGEEFIKRLSNFNWIICFLTTIFKFINYRFVRFARGDFINVFAFLIALFTWLRIFLKLLQSSGFLVLKAIILRRSLRYIILLRSLFIHGLLEARTRFVRIGRACHTPPETMISTLATYC